MSDLNVMLFVLGLLAASLVGMVILWHFLMKECESIMNSCAINLRDCAHFLRSEQSELVLARKALEDILEKEKSASIEKNTQ